MHTALLVPVKAFDRAKQRLAPVFDPATRARFAEWSAERVLAAASGSIEPIVVCDDPAIADWSRRRHHAYIETSDTGLNRSLAEAFRRAQAAGFEHLIIAHSDLAAADSFECTVAERRAVLVPDLRRDGTNVMSLPIEVALATRPLYGTDSFDRHRAQFERLGVEVDIVEGTRLSLDIDTPDDLAHPTIQEVLPEWLPMNQVNQH